MTRFPTWVYLAAWRHRLAHRLGWNLGRIVSALDKRGTIWIGFRCSTCGRVTGIHASLTCAPKPHEFT